MYMMVFYVYCDPKRLKNTYWNVTIKNRARDANIGDFRDN